ncbi:DotI/IcmL family type IV secretion protein [Legionella fallonii]|uniref:IcmL-like protein n=1 Tax=Legionella fallonii LLAP-10 TaxID=1212491 RepID=A0A098G228_9GAMM|nr:DotI/IcmL family type IV secretion protein [Legionella fallonii]CEG56024.1 IcmL-like protein [Legionella fallonii LLAP-10]
MKRTMLWGALFTLMCTQVQAEGTQPPTQTQNPGSAAMPVTNPTPVTTQTTPNTQPMQGTQQVQPQVQNPSQTVVQPQNQGQPTPAQVQNPHQAQPGQQTTVTQPQAQPAPVINCEYKISAQTKSIEQSLVLTWSEKAVVQAFDFAPATLDSQMQKLKLCFTEQGWAGFNSALEKSGNIEAIKTQKLTVSSQLDGQPQVTEAKGNQWKITLPLQVVYQNDKEKVTQLLNVNVTVGRKMSGDLGIAQMIATPRTPGATQQPSGSATPNKENPTPTTSGTPPTNQQQPTTTAPH